MTDLTATLSLSGLSSLEYDDSRGLLYLVSSTGQFVAWNPLTQAVVGSVALGAGAGALALTPDGQYAIVGGRAVSPNADAVDRIDLSSLTAERLTLAVPAGTARGVGYIAINDSGVAVFSSAYDPWMSGGSAVLRFDPEAASPVVTTTSIFPTGVRGGQFLASAAGSDLILYKENDALQGRLGLYNPQTGVFHDRPYTYAGDPWSGASVPGGPNGTRDAISASAGLIADLAWGNIHVYDFQLAEVADLTPQISHARTASFSADGHQLFLWSGETISVYDTQLWQAVGSLTPSHTGLADSWDMTISGDGRFLFVPYGSALTNAAGVGVESIDLSARLHLTVRGDGVHTELYGSVGADLIISSSASERIDGGGGEDTVSYALAGSGVTVSLALQGQAQITGGGGTDTLVNIRNLIGSAFADHLVGDGGDNLIDGGGGADVLDGGAGTNTLSFASSGAGVTVDLRLQGQAQDTGSALATFSGFQNLIGSSHSDHLTGDAGHNVIDGGGGNDVLDGGGGIDTLSFASAVHGVAASLMLQGQAQNTGAGTVTLTGFADLTGSAYDDTLEGDGADNVINGAAGTNTVSYAHAASGVTVSLALQGQAQDTVGAGIDTLTGFRNLTGSAYDDVLAGDAADNIIAGGGGHDTLDGAGGINTASFAWSASGVTISLGLQGQAQALGAGSVTLSNFQNLTGSASSDILAGDSGANRLDGGGGVDTVTYAGAASGVSVSLSLAGQAQNTGGAGSDTLIGFQNLIGSAFDDTLEGDSGANRLDGGSGTNTVSYLHAASGVTVSLSLQGTAQNTLGAGLDTLVGFQNLTGSAFDDTLEGDAGNNVLDGAGGRNTASYAHAAAGVSVSLALTQAQDTGGAGTDTLINIRSLVGSAFDDTLEGGASTVLLDGGAGVNTLTYAHSASRVTVSLALQGANQFTGQGAIPVKLLHFQNLVGSAFDDVLEGDAGANRLDGGSGVNTLSYASAAAGVAVSLALQGQAQNTRGAGSDTVTNFQKLTGSKFADVLEGDGGDNLLDGGGGADTVSYVHAAGGVTVNLALQGQAQQTRGAGVDTLLNFKAVVGSGYADVLTVGYGVSTLTGGGGADTFVVQSADAITTITDFSHADGDRIDLSAISYFVRPANVLAAAVQAGADAFIPIGSGSVRLLGTSLASLTAADFILGAGPTVGPGIGGAPQAGSAGGGTLAGGAGDDWLQGQVAADTLHGGAGSDYLDGGAGLNTAAYDGAYLQYRIAPGAASVAGGPEGGTDVLVNIQRVQFIDGYLALSPTDTAGQVYRVYAATLDRTPDPAGFANWTHSLNSGTSLKTMVDGFVGSSEFQAKYGALDNTAFVTLLYKNVLHRDPDASGLNNWITYLNQGHSRAEVVLGFSESQEDIAALSAPVQRGLWVGDAAAAQTARLYDTVLGRLPDASGLANWTHSLNTGTTLLQATQGFVGSAEFQAVYGNLDNSQFVQLLYRNTLHRQADASGLANWVSFLNSGHSRAEVVLGFSESQEHIANTAAHVDYGVWVV